MHNGLMKTDHNSSPGAFGSGELKTVHNPGAGWKFNIVVHNYIYIPKFGIQTYIIYQSIKFVSQTAYKVNAIPNAHDTVRLTNI